jgi:hypothetical protein
MNKYCCSTPFWPGHGGFQSSSVLYFLRLSYVLQSASPPIVKRGDHAGNGFQGQPTHRPQPGETWSKLWIGIHAIRGCIGITTRMHAQAKHRPRWGKLVGNTVRHKRRNTNKPKLDRNPLTSLALVKKGPIRACLGTVHVTVNDFSPFTMQTRDVPGRELQACVRPPHNPPPV